MIKKPVSTILPLIFAGVLVLAPVFADTAIQHNGKPRLSGKVSGFPERQIPAWLSFAPDSDLCSLKMDIESAGAKVISLAPEGKLIVSASPGRLKVLETLEGIRKVEAAVLSPVPESGEIFTGIRKMGVRFPSMEKEREIEKQTIRVTDIEPNQLSLTRARLEGKNPTGRKTLPGETAVIAEGVQIPSIADNSVSKYFPPIGDQGGQGSCTAWATAYYFNTYTQAKDEDLDASGGNTEVINSPAFIYNLINNGLDRGSWPAEAMQRFCAIGCCSWDLMPYSWPDYTTWPTEDAWIQALRNKTLSHHRIDGDTEPGLALIKQHLANGEIAVVITDCYSNWNPFFVDDYERGVDNDVLFSHDGEALLGAHAMTLVGYDDNRPYYDGMTTRYGAFLIANSWGDMWGTNNTVGTQWYDCGYMWVSYDYFKEDNDCFRYALYNEDREDYRPRLYAVGGLNHEERGRLTFSGGVGAPESADWNSPPVIDRDGGSSIGIDDTRRVPVDLTDGISAISDYDNIRLFVGLSVFIFTDTEGTITSADFYHDFDGDGLFGAVSSPDPVVTVMPDENGFATVTFAYNPGFGIIAWSSYLGGSDIEYCHGLAVDSSGSIYAAGYTFSSDFPTTSGAFDRELDTVSSDVFVAKINSNGTALEYSTFLGGKGEDIGYALAVDSSGRACVAGHTESRDFPTTPGAFDTKNNQRNKGFIARLNPSGTLPEYSTFLGGADTDWITAVACDSSSRPCVTGYTYSTGFPTTPGVFDDSLNGSCDVFISRLNASGSELEYSTFLGGSLMDRGRGIVVDSSGYVYVTGYTYSADFPMISGGFDDIFNGSCDVFVVSLDPDGTAPEYSTFLGGTGTDQGFGIALDSGGSVYVIGKTGSFDFPVTSGAYAEVNGGGISDAFVARLVTANTGQSSLTYSTYLGGAEEEWGLDLMPGSSDNVYVTGCTKSADFPTTPYAFDNLFSGYFDVFISKLNPAGTSLDYSTFLGGSGDDVGYEIDRISAGSFCLAGYTSSPDFPTTSGAFDESHNGGLDVFVAKLFVEPALSGTVIFGYPGRTGEQFVRVDYQVREPGVPPAPPLCEGTLTVCLTPGNPAAGSYGIVDDIPDGTYDVALKHSNHTADAKPVVISGGEAAGIDFTLWAGDCDGNDNMWDTETGDNDVDWHDYYVLYYQYIGQVSIFAGEGSDFDGDSDVDFDDYYGLYYGYLYNPDPGNWY